MKSGLGGRPVLGPVQSIACTFGILEAQLAEAALGQSWLVFASSGRCRPTGLHGHQGLSRSRIVQARILESLVSDYAFWCFRFSGLYQLWDGSMDSEVVVISVRLGGPAR